MRTLKPMLDLVFMGTAEFAVPSLRTLAGAGQRVRAVVTQPDRPRGRGLHLQASPVKEAAQTLSLPALQPEKASDPEFVAELRSLRPQVIVVVAYGQILRPAVLEIPPLGCVNLHASLLPELRGAAPIAWAIIRGYRETGVTTMYMDPGMDTGDIILQEPEPIHPEDTAGDLAGRLAVRGADLLRRTLALIEEGRAPRVPQDHARATYAPRLKPEDGAVEWNQPAASIHNRIHGCNPVPGAYAARHGARVKLWRARVVASPDPQSLPGTVLTVTREGPILATQPGAVLLLEVQAEGRARLSGEAFARGHRVQPGERWESGHLAAPRS
ncbi:MAG: methionyl-tRNA formyltransferase [Armatimonadetes bacterium]|nr:methionyl-tRNA formyltransferase [Armatimonadota bacterium]